MQMSNIIRNKCGQITQSYRALGITMYVPRVGLRLPGVRPNILATATVICHSYYTFPNRGPINLAAMSSNKINDSVRPLLV